MRMRRSGEVDEALFVNRKLAFRAAPLNHRATGDLFAG
jgi:hypothetical protein